jgi:acyl-CoA thioester hydrolase
MLREHEIQIRVRYQETDAQGRVHHANYFTYFEMGRVEQLRASGYDYRKLEEEGVLMVVYDIGCRYLRSACYDDVLTLKTKTKRITATRVFHEYIVTRDDDVIVKAHSTLACVNRDGDVQRLPEWMALEG